MDAAFIGALIVNIESVLYVREPSRAERASALSGMAALVGATDEKELAAQLNINGGHMLLMDDNKALRRGGPLELCRGLLSREEAAGWQRVVPETRLREIYREFTALYARYMGEARVPVGALETLRALKARDVRLFFLYSPSLWDWFTDGFAKSELAKAFEDGVYILRHSGSRHDWAGECMDICREHGVAPEECGYVTGQTWRDIRDMREGGPGRLILYRPDGLSAREKQLGLPPEDILARFGDLPELEGLPD